MAVQTTTLHALESSCALEADGLCDLRIATPVRTDLREGQRFSRPVRLHFGPLGSWTLDRGSLDLRGSVLADPGARQVFFGSGSVFGLQAARPEWFAAPIAEIYPLNKIYPLEKVYPREALLRAYLATVPWGTVQMGSSTYLSPFFDPSSTISCLGHTLPFDSPRNLIGVARPRPDSTTRPTRLVDGTVVAGELCSTSVLRLAHLGVDAGAATMARFFGGRLTFAVQVTAGGPLGAVEGTRLEDVSVLASGMSNQHSLLLEGQRKLTVQNLWVWTTGGTHGLVLKSFDSTVDGYHCAGAIADCLILKSDYATDGSGQASDDRVSHVDLHALSAPGDTGGIVLDGRWDALHHVSLSQIQETGLSYGIIGLDSVFHHLRDVSVQGWAATGMRGPCLVLDGPPSLRVANAVCTGAPGTVRPEEVVKRPRQIFARSNLRLLYTQLTTDLAWTWHSVRPPMQGSLAFLAVIPIVAVPALLWLAVRRLRGRLPH